MRVQSLSFRYSRSNWPYGGPALANHLSRHHILSYAFMLTFAVVIFWYEENIGLSSDSHKKLDDFYSGTGVNWRTICKDFKGSYLEAAVSKNIGVLNWICWAQSNLFIGPSGIYREDDPSQKMEGFPIHMNPKQKELATKVKAGWSSVSSSRIVGEAGQMINISVNVDCLDDKKRNTFIPAFLDYITASREVYKTRFDDWVIIKNKIKYDFWVQPFPVNSKNIQGEKVEIFRFSLKVQNEKIEKNTVIRLIGFQQANCGVGYASGVYRKSAESEEDLQGTNW